jgi:hypothetical protein
LETEGDDDETSRYPCFPNMTKSHSAHCHECRLF